MDDNNVRDTVGRFTRGKAVAIGDAAHPHLPSMYPNALFTTLLTFITSTRPRRDLRDGRCRIASLDPLIPQARGCHHRDPFAEMERMSLCPSLHRASCEHGPLKSVGDLYQQDPEDDWVQGVIAGECQYRSRPVQMWLSIYDVCKKAESFLDREMT